MMQVEIMDYWVEIPDLEVPRQIEVHEVHVVATGEILHVLVTLTPPSVTPTSPPPACHGQVIEVCACCGGDGHSALECKVHKHPRILGSFRSLLRKLSPELRDPRDASRYYLQAVLEVGP